MIYGMKTIFEWKHETIIGEYLRKSSTKIQFYLDIKKF